MVLSHLHGDHIADMTLLRYAIPYRKRFRMGEMERMAVFCPSAPEAEYGVLREMKPMEATALRGKSRRHMRDYIEARPVREA